MLFHREKYIPPCSYKCNYCTKSTRDCGNTECFINLGDNAHLDEAYGGYCVFAEVAMDDAVSFATVDKIAAMVKSGQNTRIDRIVQAD